MADFDINSLLQNPLFLGGVSGLLAPTQDRAKAMLGGIQTAVAQKNAAQQQQLNAMKIAALEKQQAFNPQDYMTGSTPGTNTPQAMDQQAQMPVMPATLAGVGGGMAPMQPGAAPQVQAPPPSQGGSLDVQGLLSGGLQAGYSPGEIAGISQMMDPAAAARAKLESQTGIVPPGATFIQGGKPVFTNDNAPPGDAAAVLQRTMAAAKQARALNQTALADQLDALVAKQSGSFDQQLRTDNAAATADQRAAMNDFRKSQQEAQQQAREFQQDQKVQGQVNQFSNQIQKIGIPQAQTQLDVIKGFMDKYKDKEIPGYSITDSILPTAMLGQEGQQMRQAVASFANVLLKTRSGAAVTDPEQRRFMEELGTGKFVSSARLRQGITQMQGLLDSEKKNAAAGVSQDVLDRYSQSGGDIDFSSFRGTAPKPKQLGNMPVADMSLDQLKALRAARKGQ